MTKQVLFISLIGLTLSIAACTEDKCQTCQLVEPDGTVLDEYEPDCNEDSFQENQSSCNESAIILNQYHQQNGTSGNTTCECTEE